MRYRLREVTATGPVLGGTGGGGEPMTISGSWENLYACGETSKLEVAVKASVTQHTASYLRRKPNSRGQTLSSSPQAFPRSSVMQSPASSL